jgi:CheY-like chemotaxis protein
MSRVLMIDDAAMFRMLESTFLRRSGCEIVRATSGAEVVSKARLRAPDLILLDAERPGLDAPSCVVALKDDPSLRGIPVLLIGRCAEVPPFPRTAPDATIPRPVTQDSLEAALRSLGRVAQRAGVRRGVRARAVLAAPSGLVHGRVKDISRSGLFVALRSPIAVQIPVDVSVRLPLPEGGARVRARGLVVRRVGEQDESHLIPGVGIRFVEIDARSESSIERYVNLARPEGGRAAAAPPGPQDA